ncbi:MAG: hypothetical protein PHS68_07335 [Candidatus Izemoplasmatales bacterium]|jgi:hypothetical protein|nr:hypothetical protein [Candidatus Izemoplasmatales bacterium]
MLYLNEKLIQESFLRLRQIEKGGKKGLERTSALMCFLAFDAFLKRTSINPPIDLDPETANGKTNRDILTREFVRLVQLKNGSEPYHVLNLGEIAIGGSLPDNRFSANFLTVPLKAATTSATVYDYPSRPKNPLLVLGLKATGIKWGIDRHRDWKANLPVFLQGRKTKAPFHDLACFVLRQRGFLSSAITLQDGITDGLAEIFTSELCSFWRTQLSLEKVYFGEFENPFQDTVPVSFLDCSWMGDIQPVNETVTFVSRVSYLEGLLRMHNIPFEK